MQSSNIPGPEIFQRLKDNTADIHERVEQKLRIFSPEFDVRAYTRLLTRFYGFWAPLEEELSSLPELRTPALCFESRLKAHLLEADLRFFGIDPAVLPVCSSLPAVRTFGSALGCLYVLEGSTLGARFIAKHIKVQLNIGEESGGSFFNAYGGAVGERWLAFKTFVTSHANAWSEEELLSAARETFERLNNWLDPLD